MAMTHGSEPSTTVASQRGGPAPSDLLGRARDLAPFFDGHAAANEANGVLDDEVVETLRAEGLLGLWVPRALGGSELGAVESLEVIEEVSRAEASTGWVLMASALSIATGAVYLEDEAVSRVFAGDRLPIIAGQGSAPNGRATAEGDGFRLSGHWSYGSGVRHADYLHSAAIVHDGGAPRLNASGGPEVRILVTPRDAAVFGDNWDVLGLRATASIDYSITSAFVPRAFTHVAATEEPRRGGHFYTLGIPAFATICHSGWALGAGRRMLEELGAYAQARASRPGAPANRESFYEDFAKAEAGYRAARALVYETWNGIQETLDRGDRLSTRQRTLAWLALNNATWTVSEVCMFAYTSAGGVALRQGAIQRLFRDVHAGTQHVTSGRPIMQQCGRELAGCAGGQVWLGLGQLVDPA
jgi:alkylation response protein AidB-like acyl-CoA dehydrogenase